jgi:hypothetical protein
MIEDSPDPAIGLPWSFSTPGFQLPPPDEQFYFCFI